MTAPRPPGWNKTLDDLVQEITRGARWFVSGEEAEWARDYERSLLPSGTVFPRGGEVWEAVGDCDVQVEYLFAAPGSSGTTGRLRAGERVRIVEGGSDPAPIVVSFVPLRYDALHEALVPADVRAALRYTGYALAARTAHVNRHFRRIEE
jgi:hypothetical protein